MTTPKTNHPKQMTTAIRITMTTLALALAGFALTGWLVVPAQVSPRALPENVSFDLQNGSFSSLSWSIAQFKLLFSIRYGELLTRAQEFQRTLPPSERAVVSARIAEMLEETLAEARTAVPLEAMQERLRWYYRASGLTNRFAQVQSGIEPRMAPPEMLSKQGGGITHAPAGIP